MRDIHFTRVGIPRWNLMSPPQLARNAPILNVVQPLVVGIHPIFRHEFDLTGGDTLQRLFGDALAVNDGFAHCHEPLVGEHRLDHHMGTVTARYMQLVRLDATEKAVQLQIFDDDFSGFESAQVSVARRNIAYRPSGLQKHSVAYDGAVFARCQISLIIDPIVSLRGFYFSIQCQNRKDWKSMPLSDRVVIKVVPRSNFDASGTEFTINIFVGDDRDCSGT